MYFLISLCSSFSRMALVLSIDAFSTASVLRGETLVGPEQRHELLAAVPRPCCSRSPSPEPLLPPELLCSEVEEVVGQLEARGHGRRLEHRELPVQLRPHGLRAQQLLLAILQLLQPAQHLLLQHVVLLRGLCNHKDGA